MSDQSGSSPAPKTMNCPTCGYLMEIKYVGDMKDKKAVCPACNTKVDLDDSFARTHRKITRKKGLFGSQEVEEIISEERSDFKGNQPPPAQPQAPQTPPNVFGQYTTGQPYTQQQRPPVQQPQVFVSGGAYTYTPGKAKSKSGGGGIGCVILLIVIASIVIPVGAGIYFAVGAAKTTTDSVNTSLTQSARTREAIMRGAGFIPTNTPGGSGGSSFNFESWKILNGHTREVNQVAFSPDGLHVATTSSDDTLRLWDISTGETIAEITGVTFEEPSIVAFSPDGQYMVTASDSSGKIKFYNPQSGDFQFQIEVGNSNVNGIAFSPDSTKLAVADYESLYLYDVNSRSRLTEVTSEGTDRPYFQQLVFSPDGNFVYGRASQAIYVWDLNSKSLTLLITAEASSYNDMTLIPGGKQLVLANSGSDGVEIVDLSNGRIAKSMPGGLGGGADSVAVSPDGTLLATGSFFGDFQIYELADGSLKYKASEDLDRVNSIAFSPNGSVIVIGTGGEEVRLFLTGPDVDPFANVSVFDENVGDVVGFASPTPLTVVGCVISSRNQVNLRGGPGTDYVARGTLRPGESREADGQAQDGNQTWWRLVDGTWVRSDVVDEEGNCTNLPTVNP